MKKLLWFFSFSLLIVLFANSTILSQWTAQTSGTTQSLYSIKAVNENVVWVGGSAGTVLRTTNGGTTWTATTSPNAALRVYALDAIDANTAFAYSTSASSGVDSKIYKTTDGGATWTEQFANAENFGNAIKFLDANFGVAYGDPHPWPPATNWEVLVTTNGGTAWTRVPAANIPAADAANGEYGDVGCMAVVGDNVWFGTANSSGAAPFLGRVYKSTNKGNNWTVVSVAPTVQSVSGIAFKNASVGVVCTYAGQLARTTDGGATWALNSTVAASAFYQVTNIPNTAVFLATGTSGVTYISRDDGVTWTLVTPHTARLREVFGVGLTAYAVGDAGSIVKWSGSPLPVELTSFAATAVGRKVELKWSTATEINNKGFEIERKVSGENSWITVGFKEGNGTSTQAQEYSYLDDLSNLNDASFSYRLKQVDFNGTFEYSQEINVDVKNLPTVYALNQNYPNPFNPTTKISYALPYESNVKVSIFSALGEEINQLVNSVQDAGYYEFNFDAQNLSSGLYFYNIEASALDGSGQFKSIKKMMLVR